jgi:hypothetical protein
MSDSLTIPAAQKNRQATASLAGYAYQFYATISAWLDLDENQTLWIEAAEDLAVTGENIATLTQVKNTAVSITLNTASVKMHLESYWDFQKSNPNKEILLNYLTTSNIGQEQSLSFPNSKKGLEYWQDCKREDVDIEPLRTALQTIGFSQDLTAFIKDADAETLRNKLIRKISWLCNAEEIQQYKQSILDKIVCRHGANEAERIFDALYRKLTDAVCKKVQAEERRFKRADLLRIVSEQANVSVSRDALNALLSQALNIGNVAAPKTSVQNGTLLPITALPLSIGTALRTALVDSLLQQLRQKGCLWIHGSSGLGKTTICKLLTNKSTRRWVLLDLRDCPSEELKNKIYQAVLELPTMDFGGIILDDFPQAQIFKVRNLLELLHAEVSRKGGAVIYASYNPPPPSATEFFGNNQAIPYLDRTEVDELVKIAGGDAEKWGGVVHATSSFGHPQLVAARINGLKIRDWPDSELFVGILPQKGSVTDIQQENEQVRKRLLDELQQPEYRELLYRLALVIGHFDRQLAMGLGEAQPTITNSGEILDTLIGPWVERREGERLRISPLLKDSSKAMILGDKATSIQKSIIGNLMKRRPFPSHFLPELTAHAMILKDYQALLWLAGMVISCPRDKKAAVFQQLYLVRLLADNVQGHLFPENPHVSCMVRIAQFLIVVVEDKKRARSVLNLALQEVRLLKNADVISDNLEILLLSTALSEREIEFSPKEWFELLQAFEEKEPSSVVSQDNIFANFKEKWTVSEFLFVCRATALKTVSELSDFFTILDSLPSEKRASYLNALAESYDSLHLLANNPWLNESKTSNLTEHAEEAASIYIKAAQTAKKWGSNPLANECIYAAAVILDEYGNNPDAAHKIVDDALLESPDALCLLQKKAKIFFYHDQHAESLAIIQKIVNLFPAEDYMGRMFTFRDAAISAAESKDFKTSEHFFIQAAKAAERRHDGGYTHIAGLLADAAIAAFNDSRPKDSLKLLWDAFEAAEKITSQEDIDKYCQIAVGNAVLWILAQEPEEAHKQPKLGMRFGMCSELNPNQAILERPLPDKIIKWYLLAFYEAELNAGQQIASRLRQICHGKGVIGYEMLLNHHQILGKVKTLDAIGLCHNLAVYANKSLY